MDILNDFHTFYFQIPLFKCDLCLLKYYVLLETLIIEICLKEVPKEIERRVKPNKEIEESIGKNSHKVHKYTTAKMVWSHNQKQYDGIGKKEQRCGSRHGPGKIKWRKTEKYWL